jgi:hypothetical protein
VKRAGRIVERAINSDVRIVPAARAQRIGFAAASPNAKKRTPSLSRLSTKIRMPSNADRRKDVAVPALRSVAAR